MPHIAAAVRAQLYVEFSENRILLLNFSICSSSFPAWLLSYPDERMTVPPYATGFVIALVGAYIGDRWRCRMALISFGGALGLIVSPKVDLVVAG